MKTADVARTTPPSARRARWTLLALGTLAGLGLAELALRVYSPQVGTLRRLVHNTGDERSFAPRPGTQLRFEGVFSPLSRPVVWQTNSRGFRSDRDPAPLSQRFRIATFGDSETFGWAVALEDSFQRRMEAIDPSAEVLNFGVPGYNVTNVRAHLERTVPEFSPDLVIYLVNKNDYNESVHFTPLSHSDLLLRLRFLWHFTVGRQLRLMKRGTPERIADFADEVDRMTRFLEERDTPLLLGFLRWSNHESVRDWAPRARPVATSRFRRELVNVNEVVRGEPKEDTHYARSAHCKMAALFCRVISGVDAGSCVPADWPDGSGGATALERSAALPALSSVR